MPVAFYHVRYYAVIPHGAADTAACGIAQNHDFGNDLTIRNKRVQRYQSEALETSGFVHSQHST